MTNKNFVHNPYWGEEGEEFEFQKETFQFDENVSMN